jgi:hypothetical protein
MVHFSTAYGMVGVGIAAAIGFVFALNFVASTGRELNQIPPPEQSQPSTFPLKQQNAPSSPSSSSENNPGEGASTFTSPDKQNAARIEADRISESSIRPTLTSLVALTGTGKRISDVADGMEFKLGIPVFIQGNFENQNGEAISNHTIIVEIKSKDEASNESVANFHGDIAAGSSITIESYWQPAKAGDYIATIFSMTSEDMTSTTPASPILAIPIKVVR